MMYIFGGFDGKNEIYNDFFAFNLSKIFLKFIEILYLKKVNNEWIPIEPNEKTNIWPE